MRYSGTAFTSERKPLQGAGRIWGGWRFRPAGLPHPQLLRSGCQRATPPEPRMSASITTAPSSPRRGLGLGLAPKLLGVVGLLAVLAGGIAAGGIRTAAHQATLMER